MRGVRPLLLVHQASQDSEAAMLLTGAPQAPSRRTHGPWGLVGMMKVQNLTVSVFSLAAHALCGRASYQVSCQESEASGQKG